MTRKASTETAERLEAGHTQTTIGQSDVELPCSLKGSKSGVAQAMDDFAAAQVLLRNDFPGADWPQAEFALDQLAMLAVQYKNCLRGERLLLRSEIQALSPASISSLHRSSNLLMTLRRCRRDIQEEFAKISIAVRRNCIRKEMNPPSPTTDFSARTRESQQKSQEAMPDASQTDRRSVPNSAHASASRSSVSRDYLAG